MKKVLLYSSLVILFLICVCTIVVERLIIHVRLPHGAALHVLPAFNNGQKHGAVILCPGGGYSYLTKWPEGYKWFPFFYRHGYTVAMLEYRMPKGNSRIPMTDAAEAILRMRQHAKEWHFDENNLGIMGFSAGGHLASTLLVTDNDSLRPNFGILFYPVISMKKSLTHMDSHDQLLGKDASEELENQFSNELHVSVKTPPIYLAHSIDDKGVSVQNSILFRDLMLAHNRSVELHVYPSGGHGWGYRLFDHHHRQVRKDLAKWLTKRKQ